MDFESTLSTAIKRALLLLCILCMVLTPAYAAEADALPDETSVSEPSADESAASDKQPVVNLVMSAASDTGTDSVLYTVRSLDSSGSSSQLVFTLQAYDFPEEYITWSLEPTGYFWVRFTDSFFDAEFPGVSRDMVYEMMESSDISFSVNDNAVSDFNYDGFGGVLFPYVEDGLYTFSAVLPDTALQCTFKIACTPISTASSDSALTSAVKAVLGTYQPRTQTVTYYLSDGTTTTSTEPVPGLAGLDWYWLSGVFLFSLVLWSFFRFLGVVFKR